MATGTTTGLAATRLRIVAEDYMELAEEEAVRQQQIQPEKPEEH
jgi:hypothetical protein